MTAALRAHCRFDVLLAVLVPVLLHFILLTTGSWVVVVSCDSLTQLALWLCSL